jgi:uncharacterized membrane protein
MSEPTPVPEPNLPAPTEPGLAPNVAAGLACLFTPISSAVFLVIERKDKFVRFWAMQSLVWGLVAIATAMVFAIAGPVFDWIPIIGVLLKLVLKFAYWIFKVAWVVVYFVCLIKAFSKVEWEIPGIGKFARRQLARMDGTPPPIE